LEFQEPTEPDVAKMPPGPRGPESLQFTLKGDDFTVNGFERTLPEPSSATDRSRLVKYGASDPGTALDDDGWHAVARAVIHPEAAAAQLRSQTGLASALIEEHVDGATLRSLHARAWLTELFPGLQPRTGQEALPVPDPVVHGVLGTADQPLAMVSYRYRSLDHLREHLRQTITFTRGANPEPYDQSILARRITRAVIAHPCRLDFEDGTDPVNVLVVRDGITRITSAWALLAGDDATPDEIARAATDVLLAERPNRRGAAERSLSQRMALGRQEQLELLRAEFVRGVDEETPSDRAVRIGQTLVVPAQIAVGLQAYEGPSLPSDEIFDDAIRSILASVHVEFKAWDSAAKNVEVGSRALRRVLLSNAVQASLDQADVAAMVDLAIGRTATAELPVAFGDPRIPPTDLWRAVYLVHALTRPAVYQQVKRQAMEIKGTRAMKFLGYAELLGPIVDLPWRAAKKTVLPQARNAWANGGVLCEEVRTSGWQPEPTDDFTELVEPALRGDVNARMTLAVAGGIALIADKLLTRNVGSAVGRTVPFRADVHRVVGDLALQSNVQGLWLLAHAAKRFEAGRLAKNSLTDTQIARGVDESRYYTHVDVDLQTADRIARDPNGAVVQLTQYRAVGLSNAELTAQYEAELQQAALGAAPPPIGEQIGGLRRDLRRSLDRAAELLKDLLDRADRPEAGTLHAFGSQVEWAELDELASDLFTDIHQGKPPAADEEDDEDPEDY
jgi:hypothetical protein